MKSQNKLEIFLNGLEPYVLFDLTAVKCPGFSCVVCSYVHFFFERFALDGFQKAPSFVLVAAFVDVKLFYFVDTWDIVFSLHIKQQFFFIFIHLKSVQNVMLVENYQATKKTNCLYM